MHEKLRVEDNGDIWSAKAVSPCLKTAEQLLTICRHHWHIENDFHWALDVAFREDASTVRLDNAPQNLTVLRHMALNLLKQEKTARVGVRVRRLKAGWDNDYLLKVLAV